MTIRSLLLTIPLQPGEGALAYLSRLAARNGVPSARSFCTDWGLNYAHLVDGCPGELGRLAALSDVPVAELVAASIRKDGKVFHVRGERMVASSLRRNRFHVCPACLKTDIVGHDELRPHAAAYGRLAWQVEGVVTCTTHGIALVDLGAGSASTKHDFAGVVRPHLMRLDELIEASLRRPASELERYAVCRLGGHACSAAFLDGLDLHVAIRFCEVIGALSIHGRGVHLRRVDETELHLAGSIGIGIAAAGERSLQHFLTTLRRDYPYGCRVRSGPRPPFTEFRAWLAGHAREDAYEPVRALLRRHLAESKPVDIKDKPGVFPGSTAAIAYAVIMNKRPRIIRDRVPRCFPDSSVMPPNATASIATPPAREVPVADAAHRLGCSLSLLLAMAAHRILLPIVGGGEACWRHVFSNNDLDALLARMMVGTTRVPEISEGMVDLYEGAARLLCAPVEILRLVLGGCFAWIGRHEGADGVGSLLFSLGELGALVRSQELKGPTLPEAAAFLGLGIDGVEALIGMGALTKNEGLFADTGIPIDAVPVSSFDGFVSANVDLRLVAQRMGLKPVNAIELLFRSGLISTYGSADPEFAYYDRSSLAKTQPGLRIHRPILWSSRVPETRFR